MAEAAKHIKCPFIHLSTDYVFDGYEKGPKSEDHAVNPLNAYGRSKLLGEVGIVKSNCIFFRPIVFSYNSESFDVHHG